MPKDYAKRPKNSKQQSKSRRHSKKTASPQAKPLTKQQLARQKRRRRLILGVGTGGVLISLLGASLGWIVYSRYQNDAQSNNSSVTTLAPDYERDQPKSDQPQPKSDSHHAPLMLQFADLHDKNQDISTHCQSRSQQQQVSLVLPKPKTKHKQVTMHRLADASHVPIHTFNDQAKQPNFFQLGPGSVNKLQTLQGKLFKHQLYATLHC